MCDEGSQSGSSKGSCLELSSQKSGYEYFRDMCRHYEHHDSETPHDDFVYRTPPQAQKQSVVLPVHSMCEVSPIDVGDLDDSEMDAEYEYSDDEDDYNDHDHEVQAQAQEPLLESNQREREPLKRYPCPSDVLRITIPDNNELFASPRRLTKNVLLPRPGATTTLSSPRRSIAPETISPRRSLAPRLSETTSPCRYMTSRPQTRSPRRTLDTDTKRRVPGDDRPPPSRPGSFTVSYSSPNQSEKQTARDRCEKSRGAVQQDQAHKDRMRVSSHMVSIPFPITPPLSKNPAARINEHDRYIPHAHGNEQPEKSPTQERMEIAISPGVYVKFYDEDESMQAALTGRLVACVCFNCSLRMYCVDIATSVLCPTCREISPVDTLSGVMGVGLGLCESDFARWQHKTRDYQHHFFSDYQHHFFRTSQENFRRYDASPTQSQRSSVSSYRA